MICCIVFCTSVYTDAPNEQNEQEVKQDTKQQVHEQQHVDTPSQSQPTSTDASADGTPSQGQTDTEKAQQDKTSSYTEITSFTEFLDALQKDKYVLVKFHAPWCGGCKEIEPASRRMAHRYQDRVTALSVNIDNNDLYAKFKRRIELRGIPTIALFDQEGKEITKQVGSSDEKTLEHTIGTQLQPRRAQQNSKQHQKASDQKQDLPSIHTFAEYQQATRSHKNVVILLHADWCSPCSMFKPTIISFARRCPQVYCCMLNIDAMKKDTDLHATLSPHARGGIPTTLFIQDGIVLTSRTGSLPEALIDQAAQESLGVKPEKAPEQQTTEKSSTSYKKRGRKSRRRR